MLNEYRKRRDNLHEWLTADPRIRCVKPAGAFYLFPDLSEVLSPRAVSRRRPISPRRCSTSRASR